MEAIQIKYRLTVEQQTEMMMSAIAEEIRAKPYWSVQQIHRFSIEQFGKNAIVKDTKVSGYTGIVGEIVIYRGISRFFKRQDVREQYGYTDLVNEITAVLPADLSGATNISQLVLNAIKDAETIFKTVLTGPDRGGSITDFYMQHGRVIESKTKLQMNVFISQKGRRWRSQASHPMQGKADNAYIASLTNKGNTMFIGWTFVDAVFQEISSKEVEKARTDINQSLKDLQQIIKNKFNKPVEITKDITTQVDKLFKLIGVNVLAFMPQAVDKAEYTKFINGKINLAKEQIDGKYIPQIIREARNAQPHIEEIISKFSGKMESLL